MNRKAPQRTKINSNDGRSKGGTLRNLKCLFSNLDCDIQTHISNLPLGTDQRWSKPEGIDST